MRIRIRNPETKSFLIFCGDWGRQTKSLLWLKILRGGRASLRTKGAVRSVYVRILVLEAAPGIDNTHKKIFSSFQSINHYLPHKQCWGSVTLWRGSESTPLTTGSGSASLTIGSGSKYNSFPTPDPTSFFSEDAKKIFFSYFLLKTCAHYIQS